MTYVEEYQPDDLQEINQELIGDGAKTEQKSFEWHQARLGRVTASRFADVRVKKDAYVYKWRLTGKQEGPGFQTSWYAIVNYLNKHRLAESEAIKKACSIKSDSPLNTLKERGYLEKIKLRRPYKLTKTAEGYMNSILADLDAGKPVDQIDTPATRWGNKYEPLAIKEYKEFRWKTDPFFDVEEVGFLTHPRSIYIGGSPDGLTTDEGGAEVKCPHTESTHMAYCRTRDEKGNPVVPSVHKDQVQGSLWITGRKYWDFISFNPRHYTPRRMHIVRCYPEKEYIKDLSYDVFQFSLILKEEIEYLNLTFI